MNVCVRVQSAMNRRFDALQNGRWQCVGRSALARAQSQLAGHRVSVNRVGTALQAHEIPEETVRNHKSAQEEEEDDELLVRFLDGFKNGQQAKAKENEKGRW